MGSGIGKAEWPDLMGEEEKLPNEIEWEWVYRKDFWMPLFPVTETEMLKY